MKKPKINKIISFMLVISFCVSIVLPIDIAKGIESNKPKINEYTQPDKPDKEEVIKKIKGTGVPFIHNEGQIKNSNIAYYANIFAGTVSITQDGEIIYGINSYKNISEEKYKTQMVQEKILREKEAKQEKGTEKGIVSSIKPDENLFGSNLCVIEKSVARSSKGNGEKNGIDYRPESKIEYQEREVKQFKEKLLGTKEITVKGTEEAITKVNLYMGKSEEDWYTNLSTYNNISMGEIYPKIELNLVSQDSNVEKVFTVNPGGNVGDITIDLEGINSLNINKDGELEVAIEDNSLTKPLTFTAPVAYQEINGEMINVPVNYWVQGTSYGFDVGEYDKTKPLIIDPLLASTFYSLGGWLYGLDFDSQGNIYVIGYDGCLGLIVAKFDPDLKNLLASTHFRPYIMAKDKYNAMKPIIIDENDNVYITGIECNYSFPTTSGAYCTELSGATDTFVIKLDSELNLLASTLLGGSSEERSELGYFLELDKSGNLYVAGITCSVDFPTTTGAYNTESNGDTDIFISKFNSDLSTLQASTLLGSSGQDYPCGLLLNKQDNIYVAGFVENKFPVTEGTYDNIHFPNVCISKLNSDLSTLEAVTFVNDISRMSLDKNQNICVGLRFNNMIQKYSADLSQLLLSRDFQVAAYEEDENSIYQLITDDNGNIYVVGKHGVASLDADCYPDKSYNLQEANVLYGAINAQGHIYLCGQTTIDQFITTEGAYDTTPACDTMGFISKIRLTDLEYNLEFSLGNPSWSGVVGQNINICNGN
ncbi:MAG: hypothetical protein PHI90_09605, partial [Clostridia bacterium]|nr:hypothetical protein [Clostridia bacterium]